MIHNPILVKVQEVLQNALITSITDPTDKAKAGVVMVGHLQGDPDPDQARISVTIFENDPDAFYGGNGTSSLNGSWEDVVEETECGGAVTWSRKFTVKARCLLVNTGETKAQTQVIASTVRSRIERAILSINWNGIVDGVSGEYVARGAIAETLKGEMVQGGGPPDAYDYHIKVRFDILTTVGVTL